MAGILRRFSSTSDSPQGVNQPETGSVSPAIIDSNVTQSAAPLPTSDSTQQPTTSLFRRLSSRLGQVSVNEQQPTSPEPQSPDPQQQNLPPTFPGGFFRGPRGRSQSESWADDGPADTRRKMNWTGMLARQRRKSESLPVPEIPTEGPKPVSLDDNEVNHHLFQILFRD